MESQTYHVKTEVFEGPLDLLLNLIERRKLHVSDISLSQVADDFIRYIESHSDFPLSKAAHFILVASTLVLLKSKSLLPTLELSLSEEESIEELEARLALFKQFRNMGEVLRVEFGKNRLYFREQKLDEAPVFSPSDSLSLSGLSSSLDSLITSLPKEEKLPEKVVQKVVSLEAMVERLTSRINNELSASFKDFSGLGKEEKINVVVSFLAVLELVKQGILAVEQQAQFGDIHMEQKEVSTPAYE